MPVIPINAARVSNHLRTFSLLQVSRQNQVGLFRAQNQIATGLKFQSASEDPAAANAANVFDRRLESMGQVKKNLQSVNAAMGSVEGAMAEAIELLTEAKNINLEAIGDSSSTAERQALMTVVDRIIEQMVSVGNRQHLNQYLFAGDYGGGRPFEWNGEGVIYRGDAGLTEAIVDSSLQEDSFTVPGTNFFNAISSEVRGIVDLDPRLTNDTRLQDLRGAAGQGIRNGAVRFVVAGAEYAVDLTGAETIGDVVDRLNAALPPELAAANDGRGIAIGYTGGATPAFTIADVGGGNMARDLGIHTNGASGPLATADLDPVMTLRTRVSDLRAGVAAQLGEGITIENGSRSVQLDLSGAETLEDVLNRINSTDIGVFAQIGADGRTINVRNRISGSALRISEWNGTLAETLGIRSIASATPLAALNDGRGVETVAGADVRISTANGGVFDIDLDGAMTLQDVVDRMNTAAGGSFTASLSPGGDGIEILDNTAGAGTLRAESVNGSFAYEDLGLDVAAVGNVLTGRNVNPIFVDGAFSALIELRNGLANDDRRMLQRAGERMERVLGDMLEVQGQAAAQAKKMEDRSERLENELTATQVMMSEVRDADLTEVIVKFQQMQTALQANYQAASRILDLNLLEFLGR